MPLNPSAFRGESRVKLRSSAYVLGYLGVLPFVALAPLGFILEYPHAQLAIAAVLAYGAVILSFLTGIHWAQGLHSGSAARLLWSCFPALVAWLALLMPAEFGLLALMLGFLLVWIAEKSCHWPSWYSKLRLHLSALVVLFLFIAWLAVAEVY